MSELMAPIQEKQTVEREISKQVQERLKLVDDQEKMIEQLQQQLNNAHTEIGQQNARIAHLEGLELHEKELKARKAELDARQLAMDAKDELQVIQLKNADERIQDHKNMVALVFRNQEIRRTRVVPVATRGGDVVHYTNDGTPIMQQGESAIARETETESEAIE